MTVLLGCSMRDTIWGNAVNHLKQVRALASCVFKGAEEIPGKNVDLQVLPQSMSSLSGSSLGATLMLQLS